MSFSKKFSSDDFNWAVVEVNRRKSLSGRKGAQRIFPPKKTTKIG
jgi:hypothetical protein